MIHRKTGRFLSMVDYWTSHYRSVQIQIKPSLILPQIMLLSTSRALLNLSRLAPILALSLATLESSAIRSANLSSWMLPYRCLGRSSTWQADTGTSGHQCFTSERRASLTWNPALLVTIATMSHQGLDEEETDDLGHIIIRAAGADVHVCPQRSLCA